MLISYHPFYSVLHNCSKEYVEHLSVLLSHNIPLECLKLFFKNNILLFATKEYLFTATKTSSGYFDVKLYSGLLSIVLKDIYNGNEFVDLKNITYSNFVNKYTADNNIVINDVLRSHQKDIVQACLLHKRGIIKSPTSSGKSYCIAELVNIFWDDNLNVLITVPTISLLHQMTKDINDYRKLCGLSVIDIGKVGDGKYEFNKVTIGIPNSLVKLNNTKEFLNTVDVLISDECHLSCTSMYLTILENTISRKVTLGFSATPDLNNGLDKLLCGMFGERIISITEESLIKNNIILEPLFKFYTVPKAFIPQELDKQALNVSNLTDAHRYKLLPQIYNYAIIKNQGRNKFIISKSIEQINRNNGPIIIIVNKVKGDENHASLLHDLFIKEGYYLPIISGYISKKSREKILEDLKSSSIAGVIAGPKILTAGISIPSLSSIILCGAGKSSTDFIQRVGRLLRKKDGKLQPEIIDFIDQQYWFKNQSRSRISTAKDIYGSHNVQIDI